MPRKNLVFLLAVLLATAFCLDKAFSQEKHYKEMETFANIMNTVMEHYVDEDRTDPQALFDGAYRGMLQTLDPYSQYFDVEQSESFAADTEGKFGGLGIEISLRNGVLTVISPIRGTPAFEAGIMAGDMILAVDGTSTAGITMETAVSILRGEPGSEVELTVRHPGSIVDTKIKVTRAVIKPPSIEFEMLAPDLGIAYMRIGSFNAAVMEDMTAAAEELGKKNLRALILDLRQNPGGLLDKAVEMCDMFLADGVIVSVRGRRAARDYTYRAGKGQPLEDIAVVVLVDEGSASASEIVAGCIRDRRRGLIVGAQTYGKGSVQNVIKLNNGGALKLTTARYYTPSDKPIEDRVGIQPDVPVPMSRDHLIALRNQEREDKLRGVYRLGGLLDEENGGPTAPEEGGKGVEGEEPEGETIRRQRVVDYQLKAALNILRWQLAGPKN